MAPEPEPDKKETICYACGKYWKKIFAFYYKSLSPVELVILDQALAEVFAKHNPDMSQAKHYLLEADGQGIGSCKKNGGNSFETTFDMHVEAIGIAFDRASKLPFEWKLLQKYEFKQGRLSEGE